MTDTQARQLAATLTDAFSGAPGAGARPWLWQPLLRLLARGEPVTTDQLAAATGRTVPQVSEALAAMPDTEYDSRGRVVGSGITLNPTPHHFEVDRIQLYTWCALDTLIFPAVLGKPARVTSPCHATGAPVRVTVEPDQVTGVQPATAVVSIVTPGAPASIRAAFCDQVASPLAPPSCPSTMPTSSASPSPRPSSEPTAPAAADRHREVPPCRRASALRGFPGRDGADTSSIGGISGSGSAASGRTRHFPSVVPWCEPLIGRALPN